MFSGILEFIPELKIVTLDRRAGLYHLSAYFFSKTIAMLPGKVIIPVLFSLVSYPIVIVPFEIKTFCLVSSCLVLTSLMGESLGLMIGSFSHNNTNQAISLSVIISIAILICGGFFVKSLWRYLDWVKYISFLRYSYMATIKLQFQSYSKIYCDHAGASISLCFGREYISGENVVQLLGASQKYPNSFNSMDSIIIDISICLLFFIFFRVAAYVLLKFNRYKLARD